MTGTERAALRLALGVLRLAVLLHPRTDYAYTSISNADLTAMAIGRNPVTAAACRAAHLADRAYDQRFVRARLALYLRAVLRDDAAETPHDGYTPWLTEVSTTTGLVPWGRFPRRTGARHPFVDRLARPLWYDAPTRKL